MRIVLATHIFLPKYAAGTEVLTFEIARRLQARGHEVHVLTSEPCTFAEITGPPAFEADTYQGVPVHRIKHHHKAFGNPVRSEYYNAAFAGPIKSLFEQLRPDLLHILHMGRVSGVLVDVAKEGGLPVVFTATDFWSICPNGQLRRHDNSLCTGPDRLAGNCVRCYASRTQPPAVQKVLNWLPRPLLGLVNFVCRWPLAERIAATAYLRALGARAGTLRRILHRCDRVIAPTRLMFNLLLRNGGPRCKLLLSAYGLNTEYTQGHTRKTVSPAVRFGFIGTLAEHKGAHVLVQAFQKLCAEALPRPVELQIWGSSPAFDPYGERLKALAADCPGIRFCGTFPNHQIGDVLDQIDLLVVPSLWYENTPLVIYSAFATRTPVIATDLGGMAEVVRHDVNGLLFPLGNSAALCRQMRRAVLEPDLHEQLGRGIPPVKTTAENVEELEALYFELTGTRSQPLAA